MQLVGVPPMKLLNFHTQNPEGPGPEIPPVFSTLEEAHDFFQYHTNELARLGKEIKEEYSPERFPEPRKYLEIFRQWTLALQAFLKKKGETLDLTSRQGARVMQLNIDMLALAIDVATQRDSPRRLTQIDGVPQFPQLSPVAWDKHIPKFRQIVALGRDFVEDCVTVDEPLKIRRFGLDTSVVEPLCAVANSCRDPLIRREAIALLYKMPHQEGLWDSVLAARTCEKLVNIEEAGLKDVKRCEDVPESARVCQVMFSIDASGRINNKVGYRKARQSSEADAPGGNEYLELEL